MKKSVLGMGLAWMVYILLTVTAILTSANKSASCHIAEQSWPADKFVNEQSQNPYSLYFPVK